MSVKTVPRSQVSLGNAVLSRVAVCTACNAGKNEFSCGAWELGHISMFLLQPSSD